MKQSRNRAIDALNLEASCLRSIKPGVSDSDRARERSQSREEKRVSFLSRESYSRSRGAPDTLATSC